MPSRRSFAAAMALAAVLATGTVGAQRAPPTTSPGTSALPSAPVDTRLPGIDPRQCGTSRWSALCAEGRWSQFASIVVRVKTTGFSAEYVLEQAGNGELHATYREEAKGSSRGGEILLLGTDGIAYRTRDPLPPPDAIIDYMLSSALMMSKLVAVLLDQGALVGPSEVTATLPIKAGSTTQYLRTDAPRIAALYGPPWTMTGTLHPAGDRKLDYALRLVFRPVDGKGAATPGGSEAIALEGSVSFTERRPAFPESFDLVGWKFMKVETPLPAVRTLGEARRSLGL
ncbi:MAG: hypothetical protein IT521_05410 [Burkholderiales bacterium]|nr:hypothetical protein [Burkholderiales bacterium]